MTIYNRLAIIGLMGSGKTTFAELLKDYGYIKISIADKVKQICSELFNMPLYHKNRKLIQDVAENMKEINENVWINYTINTINTLDPHHEHKWVVDDCRFPNEYQILKENGFKFLYLSIDDYKQNCNLKDTYKTDYEDHIKNKNHISEAYAQNLIGDDDLIHHSFDTIESAKEYIQNTLL